MKKDNEKKMFIVSLFLIISITSFVMLFYSSIDFNNDLIGKAIHSEMNNNDINNIEKIERNITFENNLQKCEAVCPFRYKVINSTCDKNEKCSGNVICGYFINDTIINMTNGKCATLNIVPDAK